MRTEHASWLKSCMRLSVLIDKISMARLLQSLSKCRRDFYFLPTRIQDVDDLIKSQSQHERAGLCFVPAKS